MLKKIVSLLIAIPLVSNISLASLAASSTVENTVETASVRLSIPSEYKDFADALAGLAAKDQINLVVSATASSGARYNENLAEKNAGETPPDIYWVENEDAALGLQESGVVPLDMGASLLNYNLRALASLTPRQTRILSEENVYGLPLGFYAEGVLVNISLLSKIFSDCNQISLKKDLIACSYEEWEQMVLMIEGYLIQPYKGSVLLNGNEYITPKYRPEEARYLRGIYSVPSGISGTPLEPEIEMAIASAFPSHTEYNNADAATKVALLAEPLQAALELMNLETMHMTTQDGPLRRSENIILQTGISAAEAEKMFVEGVSLFLRGDSKQGLKIEQDYMSLKNKLALIPIKLPEINEAIQENNSNFGMKTGGYFCINTQSEELEAVASFLLRLYSTKDGYDLMQEYLYMLPYTNYYSSFGINRQVEMAVATNAMYLIPTVDREIEIAQKGISDWLSSTLMTKSEWEIEDYTAFANAALNALGITSGNVL